MDDLLTVAQAAALLTVSEATVRRMLASGELTRVEVRGCVRIKASEVADIKKGRTSSQSETASSTPTSPGRPRGGSRSGRATTPKRSARSRGSSAKSDWDTL
jgi:excisionase family DNA binding protein